MTIQSQPAETVQLRSPKTVMRLERLGSLHQCRLSFMRTLLRRMKREAWVFERPVFDIDANGVGVAVYAATTPERTYSLVCFAHDLPDEQRSDRVIATAWDATFTLFDGAPTAADIERLSHNVPKQEAGRVSESELVLARANRSVRLFNYIVDSLAEGLQPDAERLAAVGYLMRTTAVYGSGKFGAADREVIAGRPECSGPFQAEMLTVALIRWFTFDIVDHLAAIRAPQTAVGLAPELRHRLGVGNSTGLGMAPFLIYHPVLINNWIAARETALSIVRSLDAATPEAWAQFKELMARARLSADRWLSEHPWQVEKIGELRRDLGALSAFVEGMAEGALRPWDRLYQWAEKHLSIEGQEQLVSLMMEPYGELVDDLSDQMSADEAATFAIDGAMAIGTLRRHIGEIYGWARAIDWAEREAIARVWYISEAKLEPRLGERFEEPIGDYEEPLAPARDVIALDRELANWNDADAIAGFLLAHPEHRYAVRRVQIAARFPYAEIRDNTIAGTMMPIDLLRCKLSFFGATHFDPRSDRWVRINMYAGAPLPYELGDLSPQDADGWCYPALDDGSRGTP